MPTEVTVGGADRSTSTGLNADSDQMRSGPPMPTSFINPPADVIRPVAQHILVHGSVGRTSGIAPIQGASEPEHIFARSVTEIYTVRRIDDPVPVVAFPLVDGLLPLSNAYAEKGEQNQNQGRKNTFHRRFLLSVDDAPIVYGYNN